MPPDFKIQYHLDGGDVNEHKNITLQLGECINEGREDNGPDYEYKWVNISTIEFENLYNELRKINAFNLKSKNHGHVHDRGGESLQFRINGKEYIVSNAQANFIIKKDYTAFTKAIELILVFTKKNSTTKNNKE